MSGINLILKFIEVASVLAFFGGAVTSIFLMARLNWKRIFKMDFTGKLKLSDKESKIIKISMIIAVIGLAVFFLVTRFS